MNYIERDIEQYLVQHTKSLGGICFKFVSPGCNGVPDRIVLLPGAKIAFVEVKRPDGGRVSQLQIYWIRMLRKLGFTAEIVKNKVEVDDLLRRMTDE